MARKMLVSDYDGTLKSDLKNLKLNIKAIKEFRKKGNLFTISTGRPYDSIKLECDAYGIEYDFLNCWNGSVLFDGKDNLLFANTLERPDFIALAVTLPNEDAVSQINYFGTHGIVDINKQLIGQIEQPDVVGIHVKLKLFKKMKSYITSIEENYPNIKFTKDFNNIFIKNSFDKSNGLQILEDYLHGEINREDIIAVGDNTNDLELLQLYNGYKVLSSYPSMYGKGIKTTREVHTLVKKISK